MNEGLATRKKKGRALREGKSRWGWERATGCERGKGRRFAPFPSKRMRSRVEKVVGRIMVRRPKVSEDDAMFLTDKKVMTGEVLKYADELSEGTLFHIKVFAVGSEDF
jgi:hypothetical protein